MTDRYHAAALKRAEPTRERHCRVPGALWFTLALIAAAGWLTNYAAAADSANDYPNRPIRAIVPQTAGSSIDTLGRIFAARMSEALGQQLVVDTHDANFECICGC